jgi:hypothetical protein
VQPHYPLECNMRHHQNSPNANMHAILECIFVDYANQLRAEYPGRKIRSAAVFASGIPEFERLGYAELVNAKTGIRTGIPRFLIDTIKRSKRQPIWIPSRHFPVDSSDIFKEMKPSIQGDAVVWQHTPSECRRLGQLKDIETNAGTLFHTASKPFLSLVRTRMCLGANYAKLSCLPGCTTNIH